VKSSVRDESTYTLCSTKLKLGAEQILPGSEAGRAEREGAGGRREKWPKQCIHI
jgi:hypothetical protein